MAKKSPNQARLDTAVIMDILKRHMPEDMDKDKTANEIFISTMGEDQLKLVVGVLYDGLAYGNWPWSPKTIEDFAKEFISTYKSGSGVEFVVVDSLTEVAQAFQKAAIDNAQLKANGPQKKYIADILAQVTEMPPLSKARLAELLRGCYEKNIAPQEVAAWINAGLIPNAEFIGKDK